MHLFKATIFLLFGFPTSIAMAQVHESFTRGEREVLMAETAILTSIVIASNPSSRYMCAQSPYACLGVDQAELGLALLGRNFQPKGSQALVSLVRFRLDGGLSKDFGCYVLQRGKPIGKALRSIDPKMSAKRCAKELKALSSANKGKFDETALSMVCASESSIKQRTDDLQSMLDRGARCSPDDF